MIRRYVPKWEYLEVRNLGKTLAERMGKLDKLGNKGWELIAHGNGVRYLFKRPRRA